MTETTVTLVQTVYVSFANDQIVYRIGGSTGPIVTSLTANLTYKFFKDQSCDPNDVLTLSYDNQEPCILEDDVGLTLYVEGGKSLQFSNNARCVGHITISDLDRVTGLTTAE
jgi:hypothetical protein